MNKIISNQIAVKYFDDIIANLKQPVIKIGNEFKKNIKIKIETQNSNLQL